ncbi:hypothetical protein A3H38_03350 [candidate division WOR-1 bacterium RIFCSPLOWO2_02_FULL_46_20]|uniref:Response regulatory domain-containing protein n=2 Tax=Saganbacteria TaxID=1703751 RepID=A0A1F4RGB2_UNCSA|nr:MAG: hypothetical protein A3J44_06945 [candidate division WOR-1 bacterium RIFCSPHIGHO2_02_FULL_45_12]OGC07225.1 MAG: hypothetical protein A3H38_03350 [candidate division WOR-1 bacterium RIFCSPLOWO2_02_FULL_46_20]OGC10005.1 MAG: hypothetical protein A3F86_03750 [candidate division WOR-1 bacterium RIFCSPLOWO2_12_FULL_45_9]
MPEQTIKILLVEDEPDYNNMAEYMLKKMAEAIKLTYALDLASAIVQVKQGGFDIILLDLNLPDSKGLDTVRGMVKGASGIPIVVLTATNDDKVGVAAVKAGAQDYLVKGDYDSRLLHQTIRHAMARTSPHRNE